MTTHLPPRQVEVPCGHEPVATVVAGAADHHDAAGLPGHAMAPSAAARPARSMSVVPEMPSSSMAIRSMARISSEPTSLM